MLGLDPVFLAALVALPAGLVSFAVYRAARSARLNRAERCGNCGGPLYAAGAVAGPSLIQGQLICEPCAATERRSLRSGLIALVTITSVTVLALAGVALWAPSLLGAHPWVPVIAGAIEYPVLIAGAIAWMKRMNRRAALRLGLPQDVLLDAANNARHAIAAGVTRAR
jgi:hypothetical protein